MAVPPALVWFQAKGHLPRVSRQSRLSANDKGDNEMIPGAVHRAPGIYLTAEEKTGKPQLGDRVMKTRAANDRRKWSPLPPNVVGSQRPTNKIMF